MSLFTIRIYRKIVTSLNDQMIFSYIARFFTPEIVYAVLNRKLAADRASLSLEYWLSVHSKDCLRDCGALVWSSFIQWNRFCAPRNFSWSCLPINLAVDTNVSSSLMEPKHSFVICIPPRTHHSPQMLFGWIDVFFAQETMVSHFHFLLRRRDNKERWKFGRCSPSSF